jgi:hypothetical protein
MYQYCIHEGREAVGALFASDPHVLGYVVSPGGPAAWRVFVHGNDEGACRVLIEAMDYVEAAVKPRQRDASPPTPAEAIVNELLHALHYQNTIAAHTAIVTAVNRIEALIVAQVTAPSETAAAESHQSITNFKGVVKWIDARPPAEPEIWLPSEPFGHISQNSLDALGSGVDVTILDLPTKEGIAVDAIIIEPKIKPIYGERDRKGFYVVPEDSSAE